MGARLIAAACAIAFAFVAPFALADLELRGDARAIDARNLEDLVRLELGASTSVDRIVVNVDAGRAEIEVLAKDRRQRGTVTLPAGHAERTIALFVGELARRLDAEPDTPPTPPSVESPPEKPAPAPVEVPPQAPAPNTIAEPTRLRPYAVATFGGRLLASDAWLLSPRIEGGVLVREAIRVGALARYTYGSADDVLGTASAHAVTGGLAASWTNDSFATGPRVEVGALAARGNGNGASSTTALVTSAAWEAELRARVAGSFSLVFALEAGWYLGGVDLRADDRTVLEIHGPFAGLAIGAGLLPVITR